MDTDVENILVWKLVILPAGTVQSITDAESETIRVIGLTDDGMNGAVLERADFALAGVSFAYDDITKTITLPKMAWGEPNKYFVAYGVKMPAYKMKYKYNSEGKMDDYIVLRSEDNAGILKADEVTKIDYKEPIVLECDAEVREFCIGALEGHGGERSIMLAKYKDGRVMVVRDVSNGYMVETFSSYKNVTNCYSLFFFDWCWAIREGGENEWTAVDDLSELEDEI